jgi:predicted O-linked N-acetylglucosamine transferase (SPINDLY family)
MTKITAEMMEVWARILATLDGWRLLLRNSAVRSPAVQTRIYRIFAKHGIDETRIEMEGFGSRASTFGNYRRAAIALDTFPFGGCATTCDALWMGVPVVTLRGDTLVKRFVLRSYECSFPEVSQES